jgi:hypothetical protein
VLLLHLVVLPLVLRLVVLPLVLVLLREIVIGINGRRVVLLLVVLHLVVLLLIVVLLRRSVIRDCVGLNGRLIGQHGISGRSSACTHLD